jgi:hypothetical protein
MIEHLGLVFIDGVGIGPPGAHNPLSTGDRALLRLDAERLVGTRLEGLPAGWEGGAIDATLGVPGLPQSASGQTALLTGENAPAILGHHQSAIPGARLRALLAERAIFRRLGDRGARVAFANAYGPSFFATLSPERPPRRASATTMATWSAGLRFRTAEDLARGEAVYHDITRDLLAARGVEIERVEPEAAAEHLAALVRTHAFTFFEHFLTDLVGHGRIDLPAGVVLDRLDRFIVACTRHLDPTRHALVVTSDHGNLEDLSVRTHTRYPVPLLSWGRARELFDPWPIDLTAIAPALLAALPGNGSENASRT